MHPQHLNDDRHKDIGNEPLIKVQDRRSTDRHRQSKSRPGYYDFCHAEPIKDLTEEKKGRKKVDGGGDSQVMRASTEEGGNLDGKGGGHEEQGHDKEMDEGAGRQGKHEDKGAGR